MAQLTGNEPVSSKNLAAAIGVGALSALTGDEPICVDNLKAALQAASEFSSVTSGTASASGQGNQNLAPSITLLSQPGDFSVSGNSLVCQRAGSYDVSIDATATATVQFGGNATASAYVSVKGESTRLAYASTSSSGTTGSTDSDKGTYKHRVDLAQGDTIAMTGSTTSYVSGPIMFQGRGFVSFSFDISRRLF